MSEVAQIVSKNWETLAAIVDSAAGIPVFKPTLAVAYQLQETEFWKAGDEFAYSSLVLNQ